MKQLVSTFLSLLFLTSTLVGCAQFKELERGLASDRTQWEGETKDNYIHEFIGDLFGSKEKIEVKRMVQVGTKDGMPVYEIEESKPENQEEDKSSLKKEEKEKKKRKKFKESKTPKALVKLEPKPGVEVEEETYNYFKAVEKIRIQKLGLKKVENEVGEIQYVTKEELLSKQSSPKFSVEDQNGPRLYAPEEVVDNKSKGKKGAVQLVWTKYPSNPDYQVEIVREGKVFSIKQKWNVMHVMVYWGKDYLWRVRVLKGDGSPETAFSAWKPLRIITDIVDQQLAKEELEIKEVPTPLVKEEPLKEVLDQQLVKEELEVPAIPEKSVERDSASVTEDVQLDEGGN